MPDDQELDALVMSAPMMMGAEYLTSEVLCALWHEIGAAAVVSLSAKGGDLQSFLKALNPAWNLVGRVCFSLAENRNDPDAPFAFMATYTNPTVGEGRCSASAVGPCPA